MGAIMMALQKSLMEQSDITETLKGFNFVQEEGGGVLVIENPPVVQFDQQDA